MSDDLEKLAELARQVAEKADALADLNRTVAELEALERKQGGKS
jgi:uncharacterized coiled-coil protein SlyX